MKISLDLNQLTLALDNPRLDTSLSELDEIFSMVDNQKGKLIELARDIVEHGLSPLDSIGVYPSVIDPAVYVVAEGNRRICVLKLLSSPELIKDKAPNIFRQFVDLSKDWKGFDRIEVELFEDEAQSTHWIEIRHMGEQSGRGLSKWNSVQKDRFEKKYQGENTLLDFWEWLNDMSILSYPEIAQVTKTNWQRILRESSFDFLLIKKQGNSLVVLPENIYEFSRRIKKVQEKLAGQTVGIVYDQERIDSLLDSISIDLYGVPINSQQAARDQMQIELDDSTNDTQDALANDDSTPKSTLSVDGITSTAPLPSFVEDTQEEVCDPADDNSSQIRSIPRDLFNNCCTIIPYNYHLRTPNTRLNKIIQELKHLDPDSYPNACGTLLRALFELSAKVYLENKNGTDQTEIEFKPAIKSAANALRDSKVINDFEHSAIIHEVDTLRSIFNGYTHNTDSYPSSASLKNMFKAHMKFIQGCLTAT